jgi:hypothetical protein
MPKAGRYEKPFSRITPCRSLEELRLDVDLVCAATARPPAAAQPLHGLLGRQICRQGAALSGSMVSNMRSIQPTIGLILLSLLPSGLARLLEAIWIADRLLFPDWGPVRAVERLRPTREELRDAAVLKQAA